MDKNDYNATQIKNAFQKLKEVIEEDVENSKLGFEYCGVAMLDNAQNLFGRCFLVVGKRFDSTDEMRAWLSKQ
jgi:hypothetical protein